MSHHLKLNTINEIHEFYKENEKILKGEIKTLKLFKLETEKSIHDLNEFCKDKRKRLEDYKKTYDKETQEIRKINKDALDEIKRTTNFPFINFNL